MIQHIGVDACLNPKGLMCFWGYFDASTNAIYLMSLNYALGTPETYTYIL